MPARTVHHGDGVTWLERAELGPEHAIVTSLPDVSELAVDVEAWREWFVTTAEAICACVHERSIAIFYQTDIKHDGHWIDKGHLVHAGADRARARCLWHKIVCRVPAGGTTFGRPAFARLLAFSRGLRIEPGRSSPDVLPGLGTMTWSRAMGTEACTLVVRLLREHTACTTVVDPFCGHGTMLAVANAHGMDAIGVERSSKRVRKAQRLELPP